MIYFTYKIYSVLRFPSRVYGLQTCSFFWQGTVVPRLEATLGVCRRISGGTEVQLTDCIACSLLANLCMKRLIYLMFMFDR